MATIEFHSGIADKAHHALRLLRKAYAKGARVAVVGDGAALRRLDADLWTADARDFVPHVRVEGPLERAQPPTSAAARIDRTPLWLVEDVRVAPRCTVLVNLGRGAVDAPDTFERVIELVSTDADDRKAARARWRHYESMGHTIRHTPMDNQASSTTTDGEPPADA